MDEDKVQETSRGFYKATRTVFAKHYDLRLSTEAGSCKTTGMTVAHSCPVAMPDLEEA